MPHQEKGLSEFQRLKNRCLFKWRVGTGKTYGSLFVAYKNDKKCLIIVPKKLKHQWQSQILKFGFGQYQDISVCLTKNNFINALLNQKKFIITHYEILRELDIIEHVLNSIYKLKLLKKWMKKSELKLLMRSYNVFEVGFKKVKDNDETFRDINDVNKEIIKSLSGIVHKDYLLILDETFKVKNYKSKLSKAFHFITSYPWFGVIGLDATPFYNVVWETMNICNIIKPNILPYEFMIQNFVYQTDWGEYKYRNLLQLNKYLNDNIMFGVELKEVEEYMPKIVSQDYELEANKEADKLKDLLINEIPFLFEIYSTLRVLDSYYNIESLKDTGTKVNQIVSSYGSKNLIFKEKFDTLKEILDQIGDEKIIIFSAYEKTIMWLYNELKDYKTTYVSGKVDDEEFRKRSIKFLSNDENSYQIMLATDSLSRGFDAPYVEYLINWDIHPSNSLMMQRIGRIKRLTEKKFNKPKIAINFIGSIIEKDIVEILERKRALFDVIIDGKDDDQRKEEKFVLTELAKKYGIKLYRDKENLIE
jgi:superfamily II DNA or RNA helicase